MGEVKGPVLSEQESGKAGLCESKDSRGPTSYRGT